MKSTLRETITFLWPFLRPYRVGLGLGFGALVLKVVGATAVPLVIRDGFDTMLAGFDGAKLLPFGIAILVASVLRGVMQFYMRWRLVSISRDVEFDLRNHLFAHFLRLDAAYYRSSRTGDLLSRATNDLNQVRMMLGPGVMYWTETVFTTLLAVTVMLSVDWQLTLIALLPAPLVSFVVVYFGQKIHHRFTTIQAQFSDISSRAQENLSGVRIIRAYAQEQAEIEKFSALNHEYIRSNMGLVKETGLFYPLLQALVGLTFLLVLWAGGTRLAAGTLTIGGFVMFQFYMGMLIWPMIAFGWVINLTQRGTASLARIQAILQHPPAIANPAQAQPMPETVRGEITFEGVTLQYGDVVALRNVSFTIPAGDSVAFVGQTGSGKSTLLQLIPRLLDPTAGRILLDGVDLRDYPPLELRRSIGFVPQETYLFSSTLAGNIAFGKPDADRQAITLAAAQAGLAPDIEGFPDGLETVIGERGITLSGGQKQRTAIARALLRNPSILILDDALSAVDTITEARILQHLREAIRGRTSLFVSHRVSTVQDCDRIFVLDQGSIREQGTHAELLALGGYYAELHQKQLLEEELEQVA
ncbi:MAG: ABC transporter ATP-binding protein [Bryobacter sp.]